MTGEKQDGKKTHWNNDKRREMAEIYVGVRPPKHDKD